MTWSRVRRGDRFERLDVPAELVRCARTLTDEEWALLDRVRAEQSTTGKRDPTMASDTPTDAPRKGDLTPASKSPVSVSASRRRKLQPHHRPSSNEADITWPSDSDVMTVEEGAAFLRIGRNALYDAIGRGEVPHRRIGRMIRLSRAALVRWLEGSCGAASTRESK
jgi:excisionase family DNA binding protein